MSNFVWLRWRESCRLPHLWAIDAHFYIMLGAIYESPTAQEMVDAFSR